MRELAVYVIAWQGETITRVMTYDDIDTARSVAEALARRGELERPDRAARLGRGDDLW